MAGDDDDEAAHAALPPSAPSFRLNCFQVLGDFMDCNGARWRDRRRALSQSVAGTRLHRSGLSHAPAAPPLIRRRTEQASSTS